MAQQQINLPTSHGGLMRYNEGYEGKFKLSPVHIILFIILIITFVSIMKIFWPVG